MYFSAPDEPPPPAEPARSREPAPAREPAQQPSPPPARSPLGRARRADFHPLEPAGPTEPAASAAAEPAAAPNRAEPEAYVAPDDPNTGARTEPFRGPFEPPPGQPKLSEFVPSSSSPAEPLAG